MSDDIDPTTGWLPVIRPAQPPAAATPLDLHADGDDEAALETAVLVMRAARQKGLPRLLRPAAVGGRIEGAMPFDHMLQWVQMLDGLGYASERTQPDYDPAEQDPPQVWVTALPHHQRGDFSVHGWTNVDDEGVTRRQQWVIRPIVEFDCRRCDDLPEPASPPLSPDAWRDDTWWKAVGKRWDEETGPRAHLLPRTDGEVAEAEAGRHRPTPHRRAVSA